MTIIRKRKDISFKIKMSAKEEGNKWWNGVGRFGGLGGGAY